MKFRFQISDYRLQIPDSDYRLQIQITDSRFRLQIQDTGRFQSRETDTRGLRVETQRQISDSDYRLQITDSDYRLQIQITDSDYGFSLQIQDTGRFQSRETDTRGLRVETQRQISDSRYRYRLPNQDIGTDSRFRYKNGISQSNLSPRGHSRRLAGARSPGAPNARTPRSVPLADVPSQNRAKDDSQTQATKPAAPVDALRCFAAARICILSTVLHRYNSSIGSR